MTKNHKVAREMLAFARELVGLEFDTKKEMDDYKREHDVRRDTKMEVKPEAKKEPAKSPKINPKHIAVPKSEHTHSFGKLSKDDEDDTKVRVYDDGKEGSDRYTVVVEGKDWDSSVNKGHKPMLGCGEGGVGVSQWSEGVEGKHLGKLVKWESLSEDTRKHIERRMKESGS